jgi:uncharacterized protein (DUF2252 family)
MDPGSDGPMDPGTPTERSARGRKARSSVPRSDLGHWKPADNRRDPLSVLDAQNAMRVPELVPIRYGRMVASPFAFYRGAAAVMAADLAPLPRTGLEVQLCGDAHLTNFGGFASPERDLIFDVNDFDETIRGPFEWDVKRLAASLDVAARGQSFADPDRLAVVDHAARTYRTAMGEFAAMGTLDIWYSRLDAKTVRARWGPAAGPQLTEDFVRRANKGRSKDHLAAVAKLTTKVDGTLRFISDPPLMVRIDDVIGGDPAEETLTSLFAALGSYKETLAGDKRHLVEGYRFCDLARKVVGVGSVGTRCWVALFVGRDDGDPLVLQIKEADRAVAEQYLGASPFENQGQRVVEGQWLMQSASDIFLGWDRVVGVDGIERDFYVRQLWDWKVSADLERMDPERLALYAELCGWTLASAHARSGDPIAISAYLGKGDRFDVAMVEFAADYAEQNQHDYDELAAAVADGRIKAVTGV